MTEETNTRLGQEMAELRAANKELQEEIENWKREVAKLRRYARQNFLLQEQVKGLTNAVVMLGNGKKVE